jgi:BlaI family transcriptional regulator, penicillinase repressor
MRNGSSRDRRKTPSELESLVMHFVWSHGPATSEQIREGMAPKRQMKDATVRTILRRLEEKGYLTHSVEGRTYIYRGLERPEKVAVSAIRQLLDRFCGGSVEQLLVGMVDQDVISSRELTELARKIKDRQKKGS